MIVGRLRSELLVLLLIPSACASPEDSDRRVVGDTTMVHNRAPLIDDTVQMELVQQYGVFAEDPESELNFVRAVGIGEGRSLYIYDVERGVKRFGGDGRFDHWLAREGQGPREVGYVLQIAVDDKGTVAAYDLANGRITSFAPDGSVSSVRRPAGRPPYHELGMFYDDRGILWIAINPPHPTDGGVEFPRPIYVRLDESGDFRDTVYVGERYAVDCPTLSSAQYRRGFWEDVREPFLPKVKSAWDGRTLVVGCPAEYEFDIVKPDGTVLRVSREWEALELTAAQREALVSGFQAPPERPAYARLILAGDGRIWVWPEVQPQEIQLSEDMARRAGRPTSFIIGQRGAFDVFDSDGSWVGRVAVPSEVRYSGYPTTSAVEIRGDTVWAVARDSLDVQYVNRYLVKWPEGMAGGS